MSATHRICRCLALATLLAGAPAAGQNLLTNGTFDHDLAGWSIFAETLTPSWSPLDATGSAASGSLRVVNRAETDNFGYASATRCVPVVAGERYAARGSFHYPAGQPRVGAGAVFIFFMDDATCHGNFITIHADEAELAGGAWRVIGTGGQVAPAGALSASVSFGFRKVGAGGEATFHLDNAHFGPAAPASPAGPWISVPDLFSFRFKVRITPQGQPSFLGTEVEDCVPETVCIAGALPTRAETFVRVIGPRPNGYLWPQIVKFTVSRVEVWIEQLATAEVNYYDLPALPADTSELPGLVDKTGFLP
jgi:hypothetical protein